MNKKYPPFITDETLKELTRKKNTKFIFIDGIDGVGKTTLIEKLKQSLTDKSLSVATFHIGKVSKESESFYKAYCHKTFSEFSADLLMLGYLNHNLELIKNKGEHYHIAIVDRSLATFFAYNLNNYKEKQIIRNLFREVVEMEKTLFANNFSLRVLLKGYVPLLKKRMEHRDQMDEFERKGQFYFEHVQNRYLNVHKEYSELQFDYTFDVFEKDCAKISKTIFEALGYKDENDG